MDDIVEGLTPREQFQRAKIDHYLRRAEEYIQMARYGSARKTVDIVFGLDPENGDGKNLLQLVEDNLYRINHRNNGASVHRNGSKKRTDLVFVVDQDERLLISLTEGLRHYGYAAIGAANYEEALETLAEITPDAVISEINFENGPRGFDLYLWIKTNAMIAETPFLFVAARLDRDILIAGKRFGVDDFILKPVDNEVVTASIANCLTRRRTLTSRD